MTESRARAERKHTGVGTYLTVAGLLTIITLVEVGVFYLPAFKPILAPALILLSGTKFSLVVMFYMHLKSDHRILTMIFTLPLMLAVAVGVGLLFLFGVFTGA